MIQIARSIIPMQTSPFILDPEEVLQAIIALIQKLRQHRQHIFLLIHCPIPSLQAALRIASIKNVSQKTQHKRHSFFYIQSLYRLALPHSSPSRPPHSFLTLKKYHRPLIALIQKVSPKTQHRQHSFFHIQPPTPSAIYVHSWP